jgi:prophage regulatory protein
VLDRLLRLPEVRSISAFSRSTLYTRIRTGLFPRPIPLGPRIVAWRESEVAAVNAARVRGASDDEIRLLVRELENARKNAA